MKRKRQLAAMVAAVLMAWGGRLATTAEEGHALMLQLADVGVSQP